MSSAVEHPGSVGRYLQQARTRAFVGREEELAVLDSALRADEAGPSLFYVHGPGGIGKSTLLRRVADGARRLGRPVVEVDGRFVERSTTAFEAATAPVWARPRAVLLVDTFESCQWSETWLRDRFLPRLAADVVVVLAGRRAPDLEWSVDPGWRRALRVLALAPLDRRRSELLLRANGVEPDRHTALIRFAGGNPLALSLVAAVAKARPGQVSAAGPPAEVVGSLLRRLVGDVPSSTHRRALEAVAQAYVMTEDLLQHALPGQDAGALFGWLRELPFVESGAHGLYPHDAAREALVADLRWRDPQAFHDVRELLGARLLRRVREVPEQDAPLTMGALLYLYREDPSLPLPMNYDRQGQVQDEPLHPCDLPAALALATAHEGEESAALVRYWYDRQPEAFRLYRLIDTDDAVAFSARLTLAAPADAEVGAADPVVAAAWRYCDTEAPLSAGEHIAVTRFAVHGRLYQQLSPVMKLMHWRALVSGCREPGLAYGFLVHEDTAVWRERLGTRLVDTGARPVVGDRRYAVFAHDWRRAPFEHWLRSVADAVPASRSGTVGHASLPREEFDEAVRQALLLYAHPDALAHTGLATAVLPTGTADTAEALRALLLRAVGTLRADARRLRGHDALVATYLSGPTTQHAAARRLRIPVSTYRRHLRQGRRDLADHLWELYPGRPRELP